MKLLRSNFYGQLQVFYYFIDRSKRNHIRFFFFIQPLYHDSVFFVNNRNYDVSQYRGGEQSTLLIIYVFMHSCLELNFNRKDKPGRPKMYICTTLKT